MEAESISTSLSEMSDYEQHSEERTENDDFSFSETSSVSVTVAVPSLLNYAQGRDENNMNSSLPADHSFYESLRKVENSKRDSEVDNMLLIMEQEEHDFKAAAIKLEGHSDSNSAVKPYEVQATKVNVVVDSLSVKHTADVVAFQREMQRQPVDSRGLRVAFAKLPQSVRNHSLASAIKKLLSKGGKICATDLFVIKELFSHVCPTAEEITFADDESLVDGEVSDVGDEPIVDTPPEQAPFAILDADPLEVVLVLTAMNLVRDKIRFNARNLVLNQYKKFKGQGAFSNEIMVGGACQIGKTGAIVVTLLLGFLLGNPTVVFTKLVSGRRDLFGKVVEDYLNPIFGHIEQFKGLAQYCWSYNQQNALNHRGIRGNENEMSNVLLNGGAIFVTDIVSQASKVQNWVYGARGKKGSLIPFTLVFDEADEMFRSKNQDTQIEQKLNELLDVPDLALVVQVSATLIPCLISTMNRGKEPAREDMFLVEPGKDYVNPSAFSPLINKEGIALHLEPKELTSKTNYTSEKTALLYQFALETCVEDKMKTGILVLDICNPKVDAAGNIYDRHRRLAQRFPNVIYICVDGRGMSYFHGAELKRSYSGKEKKLGQIIKRYDNRLHIPMVVIGYSQLQRSVSVRSKKRVVTHMINCLTSGMAIERVVQAFGRGSGHNLSVLKENGFSSVTVLATRQDFEIVPLYNQFVQWLCCPVESGSRTLRDVINGETKIEQRFVSLFSGAKIYRPIGSKKMKNDELWGNLQFQKPDNESDTITSTSGDGSALSEDDDVDEGRERKTNKMQQLKKDIITAFRLTSAHWLAAEKLKELFDDYQGQGADSNQYEPSDLEYNPQIFKNALNALIKEGRVLTNGTDGPYSLQW